MRILFVDDETSVLEGIENRLRRYRNRWQMSFSSGGKEALLLMRDQPFDAVVSDMRMPEMDGSELLSHIRAEFSDTLRIVLTGQTANEQILRSLAVAHRVLNKPCDAVLLEAAIAEAIDMQALINNKGVRTLIDNIKELPTLPKLHMQLTRLIKSGEYDIHAAATIVEQDQVIAARVLQLVNSSYYGLARKVTNIRDAVSYLGTDCLRGLVLNLELFAAFENSTLAKSFSLQKQHDHALLTARFASLICEGKDCGDLAYAAALLHDIGQLVLAYVIPHEYDEVLRKSEADKITLVDLERNAFGFTHADVSAHLLSLWDLPFSLIQVVGYHHSPANISDTDFDSVGLIHIASELAKATTDTCYEPNFDPKYTAEKILGKNLTEWSNILKESMQNEQH